MEGEIHSLFISLLLKMELLNKPVKIMCLKIQNNFHVPINKSAWIVFNQREQNLEIKETVGLKRHTLNGELFSLEGSLGPKK